MSSDAACAACRAACRKENVIHYKNSDGFEYWIDYDEYGNRNHYKDSKGFEYWIDYDERGNKIYYKNIKLSYKKF